MASWTGYLAPLPTLPLTPPYQASSGPHNTRLATPPIMPAYRMSGYYVAGLVWETWISYGYPNTTPPSGHSLVNLSYIRLQ
jgi:hypothetical protein